MVETTELLNVAIRRWMEKNSEYLDVVQPLEDAVTESPVQATFCGDIARMREAQQALMNSGLWERITVLRTQYEERDLCIVDVLNHGCSKGHALRRWAEHRGIERQQVMAIGDNYNDIEMLEFAGVPVIMANACDELKQNGWMVTLGNNQDGVAHAVEVGAGMMSRRWPWLALLLCAVFRARGGDRAADQRLRPALRAPRRTRRPDSSVPGRKRRGLHRGRHRARFRI